MHRNKLLGRPFCSCPQTEVQGDGPFVPAPGLMITHESGGRKQKDRPLLCLKLFIFVCLHPERNCGQRG